MEPNWEQIKMYKLYNPRKKAQPTLSLNHTTYISLMKINGNLILALVEQTFKVYTNEFQYCCLKSNNKYSNTFWDDELDNIFNHVIYKRPQIQFEEIYYYIL